MTTDERIDWLYDALIEIEGLLVEQADWTERERKIYSIIAHALNDFDASEIKTNVTLIL